MNGIRLARVLGGGQSPKVDESSAEIPALWAGIFTLVRDIQYLVNELKKRK